jgi:hypothetical protein
MRILYVQWWLILWLFWTNTLIVIKKDYARFISDFIVKMHIKCATKVEAVLGHVAYEAIRSSPRRSRKCVRQPQYGGRFGGVWTLVRTDGGSCLNRPPSFIFCTHNYSTGSSCARWYWLMVVEVLFLFLRSTSR